MDFHKASYLRHQELTHASELVHTWHNENTVDYWRHQRMYCQLDSLLMSYADSKWLTIGDGRYGTDAHYLSKFGVSTVATDINENLLKQAKEDGFISNYKIENAERLSFKDHEFDFVLCKESYHHFPRPSLALYEMLRVAEKGVILIEPNDQSMLEPYRTGLRSSFFWFRFSVKQFIKKIIGKRASAFPNRYEPIGNYVYTISRREIEKVALGLNLEAIAFKGLNDFYTEGVEYEEVKENGRLLKEVKENIRKLDKISATRPETSGLLIAMIFKTLPNPECIRLLRQNQFEVILLERNPYIKS